MTHHRFMYLHTTCSLLGDLEGSLPRRCAVHALITSPCPNTPERTECTLSVGCNWAGTGVPSGLRPRKQTHVSVMDGMGRSPAFGHLKLALKPGIYLQNINHYCMVKAFGK